MLSNHPFAVERLRWWERYRETVPHLWHLCRYCRREVEDKVHALLVCDANTTLMDLRQVFKRDIQGLVLDFHCKVDSFQQLTDLLHHPEITSRVAKYIYNVCDVFNSVPMFVPPPYMYLPAV